MTTFQFKRGTDAEHSNYIGDEGEITTKSDDDYRPVVHDGVTSGGYPLAFLSEVGSGGSTSGNGDGTLPSGAIHRYLVSDFTTSNWPDDVGSADISTISGLSADGSAFAGYGGVDADGSSHGTSTTMGSFGSNLDGTWSLVVPFSTTDNTGFILGASNVNDDTFFYVDVGRNSTSNKFGISRRGTQGNGPDSGNIHIVESQADVNDANDYVAIIVSTGATASDLSIYFEPASDASTVNTNMGALDTPTNFDVPMAYGARNEAGTVELNLAVKLSTPIWFNQALSQSERSDVFDLYGWYDPATDAP